LLIHTDRIDLQNFKAIEESELLEIDISQVTQIKKTSLEPWRISRNPVIIFQSPDKYKTLIDEKVVLWAYPKFHCIGVPR